MPIPGYDILLQSLIDERGTLAEQIQNLDTAIAFMQNNSGPCQKVIDMLTKVID